MGGRDIYVSPREIAPTASTNRTTLANKERIFLPEDEEELLLLLDPVLELPELAAIRAWSHIRADEI
jgi:hypothetical protein